MEVSFTFDSEPVHFVELYPYATDAEHFDSQSEEQFLSYAALLGRVQTVLSELPHEITEPHNSAMIDGTAFGDGTTVGPRYYDLSGWFRMRKRRGLFDEVDDLWYRHCNAIEYWIDQTGALQTTSPMVLLHDTHPHNAFFRNDLCALIYDYERVGLFDHADVLAFAIHRFVRERICLLAARHVPNLTKEVKRLVDAFLAQYRIEGPPIPGDFLDSLHLRVADSTLRKVLGSLEYIAMGRDVFGRSREQLVRETRKFMGFLAEAPAFKR